MSFPIEKVVAAASRRDAAVAEEAVSGRAACPARETENQDDQNDEPA
jgi:hypothetical protein